MVWVLLIEWELAAVVLGKPKDAWAQTGSNRRPTD